MLSLLQKFPFSVITLFLCGTLLSVRGQEKNPDNPVSDAPNTEFQVLFFATRLNPNLDWWTHIPPNTGPKISEIDKVYRGEKFTLIPFIVNYQLNEDSDYSLSYTIEQKPPDDKSKVICSYSDFTGHSPSPNQLLIPPSYPTGYLEDTDPLGTYLYTIHVTDNHSGKTFSKEVSLELIEWSSPDPISSSKDISEGLINYHNSFKPQWLYAAYQSPELDMKQKNSPTGYNSALLSFFKSAFTNNAFLVPYLRSAFADNSKRQRQNQILLMAVLGQEPFTPEELSEEEIQYQTDCRALYIADPYEPVQSPDQLDLLWGEFFATGDYVPIAQILTALELAKYADAVEQMEKQKKMPDSDEGIKELWLGLTFKAAVWSIQANCKQSPLVMKYCAWAYENDSKLESGRIWLGFILSRVWPERYQVKSSN